MFNAVQFDLLPWNSQGYVELFAHIKQERPGTAILLQAHKTQMEKHGPKELSRRLGWYKGLVDYVLFDASHGTGARLDADALAPFVMEASHLTHLGVGIAGGLDGPTVTSELPRLMASFPDLSFDAEGKLHNDGHPKGALNMIVVKPYLTSAIEVIKAATKQ